MSRHSFLLLLSFFFFNDPATTEIYTLSLHDALPIFVAADCNDGRLLGMTGVCGTAAPKQAHRADIWGVYVRPDARGQGLGDRLVGAALDWARGRGLLLVTLAVIPGNHRARRCYAR